MPGAGYRDWVAGDIPTAVQFDTFLQEQTVMVFATAAARDTALATAKSEGMTTYQLDSNSYTVYTGSVWATTGPVHGSQTWTPTWTQGATITKSVQQATYTRGPGREITANFSMTATSAGTVSSPILFGLPVAAAASVQALGTITMFDASSSIFQPGLAYNQGGSAFGVIITNGTSAAVATALPSGAIASGDLAFAEVRYQAAADA